LVLEVQKPHRKPVKELMEITLFLGLLLQQAVVAVAVAVLQFMPD
jgi:hypothetical protein